MGLRSGAQGLVRWVCVLGTGFTASRGCKVSCCFDGDVYELLSPLRPMGTSRKQTNGAKNVNPT